MSSGNNFVGCQVYGGFLIGISYEDGFSFSIHDDGGAAQDNTKYETFEETLRAAIEEAERLRIWQSGFEAYEDVYDQGKNETIPSSEDPVFIEGWKEAFESFNGFPVEELATQ